LHDNFVLVRKVARKINQRRALGVLLKIDPSWAFDSMSWAFLFEVPRHMGFGDLFLKWIGLLLYTSNTRVTVNGVTRDIIHDVRGLRQGEPTSPTLFVAGMEVLIAIVAKAAEDQVMQNTAGILPLRWISIYADDVVLFFKPEWQEVAAVKEIMNLFGEASDLKTNYRQTTTTIIIGDDEDMGRVHTILYCQLAEFPIKYLGLQFALRSLTRAQYKPTLDSIVHFIPAWQRERDDCQGQLFNAYQDGDRAKTGAPHAGGGCVRLARGGSHKVHVCLLLCREETG
jgi:hypothetical protein